MNDKSQFRKEYCKDCKNIIKNSDKFRSDMVEENLKLKRDIKWLHEQVESANKDYTEVNDRLVPSLKKQENEIGGLKKQLREYQEKYQKWLVDADNKLKEVTEKIDEFDNAILNLLDGTSNSNVILRLYKERMQELRKNLENTGIPGKNEQTLKRGGEE